MADDGPCSKGVIPNESNPGRSGWFGVTVLGNIVSWQEVASARTEAAGYAAFKERIQEDINAGALSRFAFPSSPRPQSLEYFPPQLRWVLPPQ